MKKSIGYHNMRGFILAVMLIAIVFSINRNLEAENKPTKGADTRESKAELQSGKDSMSQLISLDLRNMEVVDALKFIAQKGELNIVISKTVTGRCMLLLENVAIKDIFDVILLSNALAYVKKGDIYYVMTGKEYKAWYGENYGDTRKLKVFHLKYAVPGKAFILIDALKSEIGKIIVDQDSGTVLIMDTPSKIGEMEKALAVLEEEIETVVLNLNYAKAKDIEDQIKPQLDDKKVGSIKADERSNQVVVQTLPGRMKDIKRVISALDKKTQQVLIDAKIIRIELNDSLNASFEWEGLFAYLTKSYGAVYLGNKPYSCQTYIGNQTKINPPSAKPAPKSTFAESVYFGTIDGQQKFEGALKYLQTLGEMKVISNPKLSVLNDQEAKIHIGRREAYVTTTTTAGQTTTTVAEEVTFVDVGIMLNVTPRINEEGYITMKIEPEISHVVDTLITPLGSEIPIIDTSTAMTTVMARDGTTIIIGGLRKEQEAKKVDQIPFLGSIPVIGRLFRSQKKDKTRSEILVMITPRLISGDILETGDVEVKQEKLKPYVHYEVPEEKTEETVLKFKPYIDYDKAYEVESGKGSLKTEKELEINEKKD
ncbi:hypothetical protein KAW50_04125 [candidate division WOR-3 bacterium]|nr:hypothetical protein [candidate division WOR-3 bacterium]